MIIVKKRSEFVWDVVEERGVHERVIETQPSETAARGRVQLLNAQRAQEALGSVGMYSVSDGQGTRLDGCTCPRGGIQIEAIPCPVHDG